MARAVPRRPYRVSIVHNVSCENTHSEDDFFVIQMPTMMFFTLPWLPRKGLAKTGVRKEPRPKKRCIVYLTKIIVNWIKSLCTWCTNHCVPGSNHCELAQIIVNLMHKSLCNWIKSLWTGSNHCEPDTQIIVYLDQMIVNLIHKSLRTWQKAYQPW